MGLRHWLESELISKWVRDRGKTIISIIGGALGIGVIIWYISSRNANPFWILACMILYVGPLTWYSAAHRTKHAVK